MPRSSKDFPASMKNLEPLVHKKAIDIANALLANGYPDDRAIPIAISQAKEWFDNADSAERKAFEEEAEPEKSDKHGIRPGAAKLLDSDVNIIYRDMKWHVRSEGAKQADQTFKAKKEAISRGREIALNKGSKLKIFKRDGQEERSIKPKERS